MQPGIKPEVFGIMSYDDYHRISMEVGDVDPSYSMLRYLCERFELNLEQRYWLAFLYATCYCGPTVFYIYNEFPDFETVDFGRMERWWASNRSKLFFQTDRAWVRSRNQFCRMVRSYSELMAPGKQAEKFEMLRNPDPYFTYECAWETMKQVYQMGRFALFLYLEAVHVVTGFPMKPKTMNLRDAESCRNGLAMAIGRPELNTHGTENKIHFSDAGMLQLRFDLLVRRLEQENPANTVWNIETTLCAYKKYHLGKRWIGFYLDRQAEEIEKLQTNVKDGVCWDVLWQYRSETFQPYMLKEKR